MKRVLLAFALAPSVVPLVALAAIAGLGGLSQSNLLVVPMVLVMYFVTIVVGVPLFVLYWAREWFASTQFLAGGACLGVAPLMVLLLSAGEALPPDWSSFSLFLVFAAIGAVSGWVFWLVGVRETQWLARCPTHHSTVPAAKSAAG